MVDLRGIRSGGTGVAQSGEVVLHVERGDRAAAGGGDGLAVGRVDDVAGREHARHRGARRAPVDPHGAVLGDVELVVHEVRARVVADRDENARDREFPGGSVDGVAQQQARHRVVADHVDDLAVPDELDLLVGERAVLHDLRRAQLVAAVDHVDLRGELGEEGRLLHGRVAAADDGDLLLAEEESVAGRAVRHAVARQALLADDADLAGRRPGGEHHGMRLVHRAAAERHRLRPTGQVERGDVVVEHLGAELLGLLLHLRHEVGAHDALGEAGEVLHLGGVHQFAAGFDRARDQQGLKVRARRVDRGGESRGAGADDDDLSHVLPLRLRTPGGAPAPSTHGNRGAFRRAGHAGRHQRLHSGEPAFAHRPSMRRTVRCAIASSGARSSASAAT